MNKIHTRENYTVENGYVVIERTFSAHDMVMLDFETDIQVHVDKAGAHSLTYGALLYALPIDAVEKAGKSYGNGFVDYTYSPVSNARYQFKKGMKASYADGKIKTKFIHQSTQKLEKVELIPIGKTILRQVTF